MKLITNLQYDVSKFILYKMKGNFFYQRLGLKLRKIRKLNNLTQEQLSLRSSVDRTYLSQIEFGRANPSVRTLYKFCRVFKIRLSELLEGV